MKKFVAAVGFAVIVSPAFANTNCDNPRDDFDGLYCMNKIYLEADRELNGLYKSLNLRLDAAGKTLLKQGQLAWIDDRNRRCSQRDAGGFWVNLGCTTRATITRAQFLRDRVRECDSSGCLNSRLQ